MIKMFFSTLYAGTMKSLKGNIKYFFHHIKEFFSAVFFKVIKLAHFSALNSDLLWLSIQKYRYRNDIDINVLWLEIVATFQKYRRLTAIQCNFSLCSVHNCT